MTIYYLFGRYIALLRNPRGGGFIGNGSTHAEAIERCLKIAGLLIV